MRISDAVNIRPRPAAYPQVLLTSSEKNGVGEDLQGAIFKVLTHSDASPVLRRAQDDADVSRLHTRPPRHPELCEG